MLSEEMLKKIQKFHFKTKHQTSDLFAGQYESAFKGRGMEFAEVREYQPGDDIRTIDWNVSARFGHTFVKVFHRSGNSPSFCCWTFPAPSFSAPG